MAIGGLSCETAVDQRSGLIGLCACRGNVVQWCSGTVVHQHLRDVFLAQQAMLMYLHVFREAVALPPLALDVGAGAARAGSPRRTTRYLSGTFGAATQAAGSSVGFQALSPNIATSQIGRQASVSPPAFPRWNRPR